MQNFSFNSQVICNLDISNDDVEILNTKNDSIEVVRAKLKYSHEQTVLARKTSICSLNLDISLSAIFVFGQRGRSFAKTSNIFVYVVFEKSEFLWKKVKWLQFKKE